MRFHKGEIYLFSKKPLLWELVGQCVMVGNVSVYGKDKLLITFEAVAEIGEPPDIWDHMYPGRAHFQIHINAHGMDDNFHYHVRVLPNEELAYYAGADRVFPLFEQVLKSS